MSSITIANIIRKYKAYKPYSFFINHINDQHIKTGKYYIYGIYPVTLDKEINMELLDDVSKKFETFTNKTDINTIYKLNELIPNGFPLDRDPTIELYPLTLDKLDGWSDRIKINFDILKEIVSKENDFEKTECCHGLFSGEPTEEPIRGAGSGYTFYDRMDEPNKKMMDVWATKGVDSMIESMFKEMKEEKMSLSDMRSRYG